MASLLDKKGGGVAAAANVDMKTSTLKPVHTEWRIATHAMMSDRGDLISAGFRKAGLV